MVLILNTWAIWLHISVCMISTLLHTKTTCFCFSWAEAVILCFWQHYENQLCSRIYLTLNSYKASFSWISACDLEKLWRLEFSQTNTLQSLWCHSCRLRQFKNSVAFKAAMFQSFSKAMICKWTRKAKVVPRFFFQQQSGGCMRIDTHWHEDTHLYKVAVFHTAGLLGKIFFPKLCNKVTHMWGAC